MSMDAREKKKFQITVGIVVLMVAVLGYVIYDYNDSINSVERQIKLLKVREMAAKTKADKIPMVNDELKKAKEQVERFEAMLPTENEIADMQLWLAGISRDTGLTIVSQEPQEKKMFGRRKPRGTAPTREKYAVTRYKMECEGSFHAFGKFINKIEEFSKRLYFIENVTITAQDNGLVYSQPVKHDFEFDVVAYRYIPLERKSAGIPGGLR